MFTAFSEYQREKGRKHKKYEIKIKLSYEKVYFPMLYYFPEYICWIYS